MSVFLEKNKEISEKNTINPIQNIAQEIKEASVDFSKGLGKMLAGSGGLEILTKNDKTFFGVHKDQQHKLDFKEVRSHILKSLNLSPDTKIVQVVGDSGNFSVNGTKCGKLFLEKHLKDEYLIQWGFTEKGRKGDSVHAINQLVTNFLDDKPSRYRHSLANVVDFHTPKAIQDWGCSTTKSNLHYYLVYGDACFGDDMVSSDALTDIAFFIEGGIQSLGQLFNFLSKGIEIYGVYNLRGYHNPDCFNQQMGKYLDYFSVGEFIDLLKAEIDRKNDLNKEQIEQFKNDYLNPSTGKKRYLFNPSRPDAPTKQAIWDKAWAKFIKEELWKKLHLCHFEKKPSEITDYISPLKSKSLSCNYVITGGPGVGKSSIIKYLEEAGKCVIHEAARDIIEQELSLGVVEPWNKDGLREKIVCLQMERQMKANAFKTNQVFFDRSPIDTLSYCLHLEKEPTEILINAVQNIVSIGYYNNTVFYLKDLGFCFQDKVRIETQKESKAVGKLIKANYKKLGFKIISIPASEIKSRADLILSHLTKNKERL